VLGDSEGLFRDGPWFRNRLGNKPHLQPQETFSHSKFVHLQELFFDTFQPGHHDANADKAGDACNTKNENSCNQGIGW
jgi:hypothetical protein